jgi:glycosyltransferase involved in cell wall biosynthesis
VEFACLRKWGDFLPEAERHTAVREYPVRSLYPPRAFKHQRRLMRDLRQHRVDIVHSHNFSANVFTIPAARLARVPVVVASVHDLGIYRSPLQQRVHVAACRLADRVFVVAEAIRTWLIERGCDPARVTVLRNGIDISRFRQRSDDGQSVRKELGLQAADPIVAMICRLAPLKGIEDYLAAAALVVESIPGARFLIVGEGYVSGGGPMTADREYRAGLESIAHRLGLDGKVVFTGFRSDIPRLLQTVTVSVLPSLSEGLSNVVLESMAAGVPVIATRVGGIPEAVSNGVTGLLVPPSDPRELATAICRVLASRDLAERLGESGRQHVIDQFSLDRMIADTTAWYLRLLQDSRSGSRRGVSADCADLHKRPA